MIQFSGDRVFALPLATVAKQLSNVQFLVECRDDVEKITLLSPDRAEFKIRTGFSFLSSTLDVVLEVTNRTETGASFRAASKGVGTSSVVAAQLELTPHESGTAVHYSANMVERTGLLKVVSAGLIQSAAKTVIEETWKSIEAKLNSLPQSA